MVFGKYEREGYRALEDLVLKSITHSVYDASDLGKYQKKEMLYEYFLSHKSYDWGEVLETVKDSYKCCEAFKNKHGIDIAEDYPYKEFKDSTHEDSVEDIIKKVETLFIEETCLGEESVEKTFDEDFLDTFYDDMGEVYLHCVQEITQTTSSPAFAIEPWEEFFKNLEKRN